LAAKHGKGRLLGQYRCACGSNWSVSSKHRLVWCTLL